MTSPSSSPSSTTTTKAVDWNSNQEQNSTQDSSQANGRTWQQKDPFEERVEVYVRKVNEHRVIMGGQPLTDVETNNLTHQARDKFSDMNNPFNPLLQMGLGKITQDEFEMIKLKEHEEEWKLQKSKEAEIKNLNAQGLRPESKVDEELKARVEVFLKEFAEFKLALKK